VSSTIAALSWPLARLGEGIEQLARGANLLTTGPRNPLTATSPPQHRAELGTWIEWAGERLGLEAEPIETFVPQVAEWLRDIGPAILQIDIAGEARCLFLLRSRFGGLQMLGPDLQWSTCSVAGLRNALCADFEAPLQAEIEGLLALADVPERRRKAVKALLLDQRLATQKIENCWLLRQPATANLRGQLAESGLPRRALGLLVALAVVYALEIAGWRLIGAAALNGRLDFGWLSAWGWAVFSLIPLHWISGWLDAGFALDVGILLKKRMLAGALRLDLEAVKQQGSGQLLGRVMESQALESLSLNGGFSTLIGLVEWLFAAWILSAGVAGFGHLLMLAGWTVLALWLTGRYLRRLKHTTVQRMTMTEQLVERMVGHRTCLAQESPERRDADDDSLLNDYLLSASETDAALIPLIGSLARGWLVLALLGLSPAFVSGDTASIGLAISLGGILLAGRAFSNVATGLAVLARAFIAWQQVAVLFHAAYRAPPSQPFLSAADLRGEVGASGSGKLVDASDLSYRYRSGGEPVLRGVDLTIRRGERCLLEGPSGGGKSTLAALLVGLRQPESGLLLLNGLDRYTLGDNWHKLAGEAPQFHENHILTGTLAFNLLMGRHWPADKPDLLEAEELCIALGLAPLLQRMPSGIHQRVGETGWQLSHGERSRIFLARALLRNTALTVLDESFAALDPETMEQCLSCALARADTLLVIAHP